LCVKQANLNAVGPGFKSADKPMIGGLRDITVKKKWGVIRNAAEGNAGRLAFGMRHRGALEKVTKGIHAKIPRGYLHGRDPLWFG